MKIACVFFLLNLRQVWADSESLSLCGHWIVSHGFDLPEYTQRITLNDVTIYYYNSDMPSSSTTPRPDWIKSDEEKGCWETMLDWTDLNKAVLTLGYQSAIQQFNTTGTLSDRNIYQGSGCCSLSPNGTYKSSLTHSFNGKDFISFDVERMTFVAAVPQAFVYKQNRESDRSDLNEVILNYKSGCRIPLNAFKVAPGVSTRKVPEVQILQKKKAGSVTVTCHVTGFYPREVQVFWLGPDLQPVDEGVTEVLPNGDGTYQTRKSVIVPEEDVGKHTYSCVVLHISVPNNITTVWVGKSGNGVSVWIPDSWIIFVSIPVLLSAAAFVYGGWRWRCKSRGHDDHASGSRAQHPNVFGHPLLQEQLPPTSPSPISDEAAQNTAASDEVL